MKKNSTILIIFLLLIAGVIFWWKQGMLPVNPSDKTTKIFVIKKGEGLRNIVRQLKQEKLIKDPVVFFILVKRLGIDANIQAGDFRLSPSMTAEQIAQELTHGTLDVWITVPEGLRGEEIGQILKKNIPTYQDSWILQLKKHEGYLFPDTYLIPKDADITLIVQIMRDNFDQKWQSLNIRQGQTALLSRDIIILASIVEREAKYSQDRPMVAAVLLNRIRQDMPLQADATVQYAVGQETNWWRHPTKEDLKINSPFNTYQYYGLPPAPIANPGIDSIKAAAFPIKTNYLYYLSDQEGRMHYAQSLEEHNENIKKYL